MKIKNLKIVDLILLMFLGILIFSTNSIYAETVTYTYDSLHRLITAEYDNGQIDYYYDPSGNIVQIDMVVSDIDTDSDGIPDDTDNCPCVSNALQIDTDGDGYGNRCDADITNDGEVNAPDFGMFAFTYGLCEGDVNYNPDANLTADSGDVCVNAPDFGLFAYYYSNPVGYCE